MLSVCYLHDLDKCGNRSIRTAEQVEEKIESLLVDDDFKYFSIDEAQNARDYEEVVGRIVDKDIRSHNKIRNIDTSNRGMTYASNNYGAPTSLTNLHDRFTKTERIAVERRTIAVYIQVSMTIVDGGVEERGYRPFGYIRDGCSRYLFALDPPCCRRGTASGALTWRRLCKMAAISSEVMPGLLAPRCANGVDAEWEPLLPGRGSAWPVPTRTCEATKKCDVFHPI